MQGNYAHWIEQTLLQQLWPANSDRIRTALGSALEAINDLDIDQAAYGNLFLEQLPERVRGLIIKDDPEFAQRCGYRAEQVFSIGSELNLLDRSLFAVSAEVLSTKSEKTILDMSDREMLVDYEEGSERINLTWLDESGRKQEASMPDLCLLSPTAEIRHSVFERIIARLGPTFDSNGEMYDSILRGVPDFSTLSIIFDESSNGIASIQENTAEKILRSQPMALVDFVPQSMAYYERFVGPVAIDQDSSAYMNETLAQYRAALFDRDLAKALEICCLGAVHDDLSPGQWLALVEDDVLWSALNSSNFQLSPLVCLERSINPAQEDPLSG